MTRAVVDEARRCIIDTIGVALAGTAHPNALMSRLLARVTYGAGPCHILGEESTWSAPAAAFCNGVAAHVLDFDDVSYEGMVHASAVVWPAVMAAGELVDATGEEVLVAFVCALEAEYALGRAFTHDLFWRGWWTTGLLGSIGAAIGAAKVMGLDATQTREAISIAACQTTGPYVLVGSAVKPYACGRAAEAGVQAALAARCGLEGPALSFEHANGFITMYADNQFVPDELAQLGPVSFWILRK
jgi:2-methylcitrate dehydratase PrpD